MLFIFASVLFAGCGEETQSKNPDDKKIYKYKITVENKRRIWNDGDFYYTIDGYYYLYTKEYVEAIETDEYYGTQTCMYFRAPDIRAPYGMVEHSMCPSRPVELLEEPISLNEFRDIQLAEQFQKGSLNVNSCCGTPVITRDDKCTCDGDKIVSLYYYNYKKEMVNLKKDGEEI